MRRVCLLARVVEPGETEIAASFGNVVELGEEELVLESARCLEPGARIGISFYVPVAGGQAFVRVAAACEVSGAVDAEKLLYRVALQQLDPVSRQQLEAYVCDA